MRRVLTLVTTVFAVVMLSVAPAPALGAGTTGSIAGKVTFAGTGISGLNVWLYSVPAATWVGATNTDVLGNYVLPTVAAGTYRLQAWSSTMAYPTTWFGGAANFATATDVTINVGSGLTGIDVSMSPFGIIAGHVTHNGADAPGIDAQVQTAAGVPLGSFTTDAAGNYRSGHLATGVYKLAFSDPAGSYPAGSVWLDKPDIGSATAITVMAGATFVADAQLYTAAEQPAPPYSGNPTGPSVAVIGDSITQISTSALHTNLDPTNRVTVGGISRQRIAQLQPMAEKMVAMSPHDVVINLGTNDALGYSPEATMEAAYNALLATFSASVCISIVTLNETAGDPGYNVVASQFNSWLRQIPALDSRIQIADWGRILANHLAAGQQGGVWTSDTIHPNELGRSVYASLIGSAVANCPPKSSSLSGTIYSDADSSRTRGPNETGLGGISIALTAVDSLGQPVAMSAVSDVAGAFSFTGLNSGLYSIAETPPVGYGTAYVTVGTGGGVPNRGEVTQIVVGANTAVTGYTFAQPPPQAIVGGTVYADLNSSGVRESGEPGISGAVITLSGVSVYGVPVLETTATHLDGSWAVIDLPAGTYTVTETQQNGFTAGTVAAGSFGGTVGPQSVSSVVVPLTGHGVGYDFGEVPTPVGPWAVSATSNYVATGRSVAVDLNGNILATGLFLGQATFAPGPGAKTLAGAGSISVYVAKYDAAGQVLWANAITGTGSVQSFKVATDTAGNVFVVGDLNGAVTFGSGPGAIVMTGDHEGYLASYDPGGTLRWVRGFTGVGETLITGVTTDATGNVIVAGGFKNSIMAGSNGGVGGVALSSVGIAGLLASFAPDGSLTWARALPASGAGSLVLALDVTIAGAGDPVVAGIHTGLDFGSGFSSGTTGGTDSFVARFSTTGVAMWVRSLGGAANDMIYGATTDPVSGRLFFSGTSALSVNFGNGQMLVSEPNGDAFVLALESDGTTAWVRGGGGSSYDVAIRLSYGSGHVHVAGQFAGSATFGSATVVSSGDFDGFVASYGTNGTFEWVRPIGGTGSEAGWGTATAANGDAIAIGVFAGPAAVMPGPLQLPLSGGSVSQFVARLNA